MKFVSLFFLILFSGQNNAQMLTSVYFKNNSYELDQKSKEKLDSLARLKTHLIFSVYGNCDPSGNEERNQKLSESRARSVSGYLAEKIGSNIKLRSPVGLGTEKQINNNSTDELRGRNRRVDVFIKRTFAPGEKISRKILPDFLTAKVLQMKVRDTFSLPDVNFVGGRHVWLPHGNANLFKLAKILNANPTLEVELQGHICCDYDNFDGEDTDLGTFNLSWTRANSIKEYLLKQGVDSARIKVSGLGHLNPVIYPEVTESNRIKNRRVELVLLKK